MCVKKILQINERHLLAFPIVIVNNNFLKYYMVPCKLFNASKFFNYALFSFEIHFLRNDRPRNGELGQFAAISFSEPWDSMGFRLGPVLRSHSVPWRLGLTIFAVANGSGILG